MKSVRRSTCFIAAMLLVGSTAAADEAPTPTDEQKATARMLGTEGVKLALGGDCPGAVDKLTRAESLVHAPTTALPLAQCDIKLGKLVAGTEILNRLVHETLPPNAPKSWTDAKLQAQPLLDSTSPRIGKLRIHVDRPPGTTADVQVTVDGEDVPSVVLDNDRPTDPGTHRITATAAGLTAADATTSVGEGQVQSLTLRLDAPPATGPAGAAAPAPAAAFQPAPLPSSSATAQSPNRVPAYVMFGVGGAGVVVGTLFGILALGAKSSLDTACDANRVCPTSSQGDINAYKTDPLVSTVGFGTGVAALAIGTILLITAHSEAAPKTAHFEVRPWAGPGSGGIAGSFP
ncbi:MAG: hypothetical protein ABSF69_00770 [Polyangiaceae bacterium]|jgi:hypothetical protein